MVCPCPQEASNRILFMGQFVSANHSNRLLFSLFAFSIAMLFVAAISVQANGDTLDFENAAEYGGDDAVISDSYFEQYGLTFTAMAGNSEADATKALLSFEAAGKDGTDGYWTNRNDRDEALKGDIGNYFMKAGTGNLSYNNAKYFKMDIDYQKATQAASGEIWDIDGPEQYTVTAQDANGNIIASLVSPTGGLNGMPWLWSIDVGPTTAIAKISRDLHSFVRPWCPHSAWCSIH